MNWWDIFHIVLLLGALQGIVLGVILWRTHSVRKTANRFLSLLLFFLSYRLITQVLISLNIVNYTSWTYHVFLEYNWIYGSLIFFYIRSYITIDSHLTRKDWWHFTPVFIEFVFSNYVKIQNFYWDGNRESLSWLGERSYVLWMHTPFQIIIFSVLILFYSYKSYGLLLAYTAENTKPVQVEDVNWVRSMLLWYTVFAIVVILSGLIDYQFFDYAFNPFYIVPVYIGMAILTYWLGLQGFARKDAPYLIPPIPTKQSIDIDYQTELNFLNELMNQKKIYKDPSLSLALLASTINIKPYQLTYILNRHLKKNFSDFINEYRVHEVKEMINNKAYDHYTLLAMAYEAGFNSKASFNRIVKNMTGKSPKELRDKNESKIK